MPHSINPLGEFGEFLMAHLRDRGIDHFDRLLAARWKAPALARIQGELQALTAEQRALARRAFVTSLDSAIHDFLFQLQDQADSHDGHIAVTVDGKNIATNSDGLQGEPFTDEGWRARYSVYGEPPEEA
jgi:hypothetical protein